MIQRYKSASVYMGVIRVANAFEKDEKGPVVFYSDHLAALAECEKLWRGRIALKNVELAEKDAALAKQTELTTSVVRQRNEALNNLLQARVDIAERDAEIAKLQEEMKKLNDRGKDGGLFNLTPDMANPWPVDVFNKKLGGNDDE